MRKLHSLLGISLSILFVHSSALAQDVPLSDAIGVLAHPKVDDAREDGAEARLFNGEMSRSNVRSVIEKQTEVKSQGSRNTCTVFAMTGLLESIYLIQNPSVSDVDFSEQFMQYWVAVKSPTGGEKGSTVPNNFGIVKSRGIAAESTLPYDGKLWKLSPFSKANRRCGHLNGTDLTRCLNSHRSPELARVNPIEINDRSSRHYDPEFAEALASARESQRSFVPQLSGGIVGSTSQIKTLLRQGIPLTLEINIFYGSWNLSNGSKLGIDHDKNLYRQGTVTYPERGSLDLALSPQQPARHAVVLVGYDDNVAVTYSKKMQDGSTKTFKRRGVYYFKNSWGKNGHGQNFSLEGKSLSGYGMILQDYAHGYGQFFAVQ